MALKAVHIQDCVIGLSKIGLDLSGYKNYLLGMKHQICTFFILQMVLNRVFRNLKLDFCKIHFHFPYFSANKKIKNFQNPWSLTSLHWSGTKTNFEQDLFCLCCHLKEITRWIVLGETKLNFGRALAEILWTNASTWITNVLTILRKHIWTLLNNRYIHFVTSSFLMIIISGASIDQN